MSGYSEEILDSLTDEERAALEEDDGAGATGAGASTDGNDDDDDTDTGGDEGAEAGADGDNGDAGGDTGGNEGAGDGDGDGTGGDADDAAADAGATAPDSPAPLLIAEAPADAEAKLKDISDKKAALVEQFDNGDITAKEYQTQLDALNKDERAIERAVEKAQLAAEMRQQQEMNTWLSQVKDFTTKEHPEYSTSKVRWGALDMFVKEIGSDPKNANLSGPEILKLAHEKVIEDLGAAPAKGKTEAKTAAKADGKPLKGSKAEPPKTLAKVPAADNADIENSKWAALDRLRETDPLAHEEKLYKMSDAERDEYLARA